MAKAARKGSNGNHKGGNETQNGSYRFFEDMLALAGTLARGRKDFGADKLHSLAESTREYAASMSELPNLGGHVASAADRIESLAEYMTDSDIEQMIEDAGTFARRHPIETLAASVAAGMAASRFMWPRAAIGSRKTRYGRSRSTTAGRKGTARSRRSMSPQASAHG